MIEDYTDILGESSSDTDENYTILFDTCSIKPQMESVICKSCTPWCCHVFNYLTCHIIITDLLNSICMEGCKWFCSSAALNILFDVNLSSGEGGKTYDLQCPVICVASVCVDNNCSIFFILLCKV